MTGTWGTELFEVEWMAYWKAKQKKIDDMMEILWGYEA
jgi:hypothetical protein